MAEHIEPSFKLTRFSCSSCDKVTDHAWLNAYASPINNPGGLPLRIEGENLELLKRNPQFPPEVLKEKLAYWERVNSGDVFLDRWAPVQSEMIVAGMELSVCRECMHLGVWLGGELFERKG